MTRIILMFLALLMPSLADAQHKPIYVEEFGFTGRPDLAGLYNIGTMHVVSRTNNAGSPVIAYWPDAKATPTSSLWYDSVAAYVISHGWTIFYVDHESWMTTTHADRLATAAKVVEVYNGLKKRLPTVTIGFYGAQFTPIRDFTRAKQLPGAAAYITWQAENEDFAVIYATVDMIMPASYWFTTIAVDGSAAIASHHAYFAENLREARRLRDKYGHGQPIYSWVWFRRHDDASDLDGEVWDDMVRTAHQEGDGFIVFTLPKVWSETYPWWVALKGQLLSR